jgi:RHS repeat-associated protein
MQGNNTFNQNQDRLINNKVAYKIALLIVLFILSGTMRIYAQADKVLMGTITQSTTATHSITLNPNTLIDGANGAVTFSISGSPILNCVQLGATPSANQNYVMTLTPREAFTDASALTSKTACEVMQTIQYIDGLGRPLQTVQVKGNPGATGDVIMPVAYDQFGREATKYLPYTTAIGAAGSYRSNALTSGSGVFDFYNPAGASGNQQGNGIVITSKPFAVTGFEASPLNRVVEQGFPGEPWQLPSLPNSASNGHTKRIVYSCNDQTGFNSSVTGGLPGSHQVALYNAIVNPDQSYNLTRVNNNATYNNGELYLTITRDENWSNGQGCLGTIEEYKDKDGHVVLKRTYNMRTGSTNAEMLSTYYVYDDSGDLAFVLPPGSDPDNTTTINQSILDNTCYQYRYDERRRLTQKKVPGSSWQYMVYNKQDQLIGIQDGNQRLNNQWVLTKYDALGRVVLTGIWSNNGHNTDPATLKTLIDGQSSPWQVKDLSATGNVQGYYLYNDPLIFDQILSVNYYDDYAFPGVNPYPYVRNLSITAMSINESSMTKGLLTASRVNVLGTTDMLWTVNYYDDKGRNIQSNVQHYLGVTLNPANHDEISTGYDFTNEVTQTIRKHYANGSNTLNVANEYVYDHMGRKRQTWSNINNGPTPVLLSQTDYNEVGQLLNKHLHSENDGTSFLQNLTYAYNERGWLTQINDPAIAPTSDKLFSIHLLYTDPVSGHGSGGAQYNGNIAEQLYNKGSNGQKFVAYAYDSVNRLTAGNSAEGFSENGIQYDKEGNIQTVQRFGPNIGLLTYSYYPSTNQLQTVTSDNSSVSRSYTYDPNGNATTDGTGNAINYNMLNLPQSIPGKSITFNYDASGQKLRKISGNVVTEYIKGIQYTGSTIDFVATEEGRILNPTSSPNYEYTLTDHLGNNRVAFDKVNGKVGEDDYYPFGLNVHRQQNAGNKYLYNGKEIQDDLNGQYDYGARFYDPITGRFTSIDPSARSYVSWSPYNYVADNPITSIDPDGRDLIVLSAPAHVHSLGHAAVLIGNPQKGYRYYSKNGTKEHKGAYGPSDKNPVKGKYFASVKDFLASDDNKDKDGSYTMGYEVKADDATDAKMEAAAAAAVSSDYYVLDQSCIDVASDALRAGKFDPGYSNNSFLGIKNTYLTPIPNVRFNNIRVNNNGTYLYFDAPAPAKKEKKAIITVDPISKGTVLPDPPKSN